MTSKKARSEELPDYVMAKWFQYTFVLMYMAFVSQTVDPWDVPVKQAVEVMQKIWDATSAHEYEITTSTPVYQKVCDRFCSRMVLIYIYISDGSTLCGLMVKWCRVHRHHIPSNLF